MTGLQLHQRAITDRRHAVVGVEFIGFCPDCGFKSRPMPTAGLVHGMEHTCHIPGQLTIDDALAS